MKLDLGPDPGLDLGPDLRDEPGHPSAERARRNPIPILHRRCN